MIKVETKYLDFPGETEPKVARCEVVLPQHANIRAVYIGVVGLSVAYDYHPEPGNVAVLRRLVIVKPGGMFQDGGEKDRAKFVCAVTGRRPALVYEIVKF